ncbi:unnamed protein product [Prunus brigantina]
MANVKCLIIVMSCPADDASDAKSGPFLREEIMSLKVGALSLCTKLSELHTKAPEHSFAYTKKTIERAFGRKLPLPEIFDNFEEKPATSGSIAQVHGAGQQVKPIVVAVKGSCPFVHPAKLMNKGNDILVYLMFFFLFLFCNLFQTFFHLCCFRFPEGLLSSEEGVYIAESVAAKNVKQAKGRFRMYEDATVPINHGGSNHSAKVEPANGCTGKRKSAKKPGELLLHLYFFHWKSLFVFYFMNLLVALQSF